MDTQRVSVSCCGTCHMENVSITHCVNCVDHFGHAFTHRTLSENLGNKVDMRLSLMITAQVCCESINTHFRFYPLCRPCIYATSISIILHHRILTLLIYCIVLYFSCISVRVRVQFYFERAHYLFIYLIDVYI